MHKDRGSEGRLFALLRSCLITRKTSFTAIVIQQKKLLLYSANFIWEDDFLMEIGNSPVNLDSTLDINVQMKVIGLSCTTLQKCSLYSWIQHSPH